MKTKTNNKQNGNNETTLDSNLDLLRLPYLKEHCRDFASKAARDSLGHLDYLSQLIEEEAQCRTARSIVRRIKQARFPVVKTLDTYQWDWPKKIDRLHLQDIFQLGFIKNKVNVMFLGLVGLGKTHLATALGHAACIKGYSVLFANAIDVINTLNAAQTRGALKTVMRKYTGPDLLILDEVGYLPIDQHGANLLFQVISERYERGSIVLTSNKAYKDWPSIFNGDATLASAAVDRLVHHSETVVIEGSSYRMRDSLKN